MAQISFLDQIDAEARFKPTRTRSNRSELMAPYHDAIERFEREGHPAGLVVLEEGDDQRAVRLNLHRAAKAHGIGLRFQKSSGDNGHELAFRRQTDEELARLQERGRKLAQRAQERRREKAAAQQESESVPTAV